MGLTHASIVEGLFPNQFRTIIIEPNWKVRQITKKTFDYEVLKNIKSVSCKDAFVLITTPPSLHKSLVDHIIKQAPEGVFVEKPFGYYDNRIINNNKISVGYVLRFNEVSQKLKSLIQAEGCKKICLNYNSNTLTKKPSGWRNGIYGGVLNEMGSHLIDLLIYLTGKDEFTITKTETKSIKSSVDDIVSVEGLIHNIEFRLTLNWVNENTRKPVWSGELLTNNRLISFDQQSIEVGLNATNVDYYVRGRDFSLQMKHFILQDKSIACNSYEANKVHDVIQLIKNKG